MFNKEEVEENNDDNHEMLIYFKSIFDYNVLIFVQCT